MKEEHLEHTHTFMHATHSLPQTRQSEREGERERKREKGREKKRGKKRERERDAEYGCFIFIFKRNDKYINNG
jgi:hypothetical protein